ncbi:uncharacterized protein V6R79_013232 [Siganus canaliculatus]
MSAKVKQSRASVIEGVELHTKNNNIKHHTSEITKEKLIVRRGKRFKVSVTLAAAFNPELHHFHFTAKTGELPSEDVGTLSNFGVPDNVKRSPDAKAVWKVQLKKSRRSPKDVVKFFITPPADAPIGRYTLTVKLKDEEVELATLVVLFNPWCRADWVYLRYKKKRKEYVMNEHGTIYRGSGNYIMPSPWDFGQFEEDMVDICLKMLDVNPKHKSDPSDDVSARCNPIYVGRVVSRMINSLDDQGVLEGRWDGSYSDGFSPTHWTNSHEILKKWFQKDCNAVKYGQCWVFACVMCSVMRLLGIPCRVVSNFSSAHDVDRNLTIDVYHSEDGVESRESADSIWNFHVWTEAWMKRPDLPDDGKYNGWQVLDPTPQETSGGVYRCGPASVKAILAGETDLKYDIPFVFAEVNADCVDWLLKADGSKVAVMTDSHRVGKNISTKSVGSDKRLDITKTYKHEEGSEKERSVFKYAVTRDYSKVDEVEEEEEEEEEEEVDDDDDDDDDEEKEEEEDEDQDEEDDEEEEMATNEGPSAGDGGEDADCSTPSLPLTLKFEEVSTPINGEDVKVNLVVHNLGSDAKCLSINISVQAMNYNGTPCAKIQKAVKEETLHPDKDLSIPIVVPFSAYYKSMLNSDSMKISAVVTDKEKPDDPFLAEDDVVLVDPPITVTVPGPAKLNHLTCGEVVFVNPIKEVLKNCTMTLSGSGLYRDDAETKLPDVNPGEELRFPFTFAPYKVGVKTLVADFDCSFFRDIKCICKVKVRPENPCR